MISIVIIGGGQAGYSASRKLRAMGFSGSIVLVCEENNLPYQRPPLSKKFLTGEIKRERLFFKPEDFYKDNAITLKLGVRAVSVDRDSQKVFCSDGDVLFYSKLLLVTGSVPKKFPQELGGTFSKTYYIRSITDVDLISAEFKSGKRLLIVGGGYIGLEIAAVARKLNLDVTIIEAQDRILKRVACSETAKYFQELHEQNGVQIILDSSITRLKGKDNIFSGILLENGEELNADFSIIGIGAEPCINLAQACGLKINNGIWVDNLCRTTDSNILAAGDCANFPHRSGRLRLESVSNSIEQAEVAALTALGFDETYNARPWFWSDQYDCKLQIAGLSSGYDKVVKRKNANSVSMWYFKNKKLLAVDAINDAKAYMVAKKLIERNESPDESNLLNVRLDLKTLLEKN